MLISTRQKNLGSIIKFLLHGWPYLIRRGRKFTVSENRKPALKLLGMHRQPYKISTFFVDERERHCLSQLAVFYLNFRVYLFNMYYNNKYYLFNT